MKETKSTQPEQCAPGRLGFHRVRSPACDIAWGLITASVQLSITAVCANRLLLSPDIRREHQPVVCRSARIESTGTDQASVKREQIDSTVQGTGTEAHDKLDITDPRYILLQEQMALLEQQMNELGLHDRVG